MTTIAKLLFGLSKKGITPKIVETAENCLSGTHLFGNNRLEIVWKQAGKDICMFFDSLTGKYKGYTRSVTKRTETGSVIETITAKHTINQPNYRTTVYNKEKITKGYVSSEYGEDSESFIKEGSGKVVTTSIDPKANVFTVLTRKPVDTTVACYDNIKIFPLSR